MSDSWRPNRDRIERLARAQLSMTPGTAQGRVAQASPVHNLPRQEDGSGEVVDAIFSYSSEPVVGDESPPYHNWNSLADMGTIILATRSNSTSSSTLSVMVNGAQVASLILPAGEHKVEELVEDVVLAYGDLISVKFTTVGADLKGVTVHVLLEP